MDRLLLCVPFFVIIIIIIIFIITFIIVNVSISIIFTKKHPLRFLIYFFLVHNFQGNSNRNLHISSFTPFLSPKFCIAFVFKFSWVLQSSPKKLKTTLMQNLVEGRGAGGQIGVLWDRVQRESVLQPAIRPSCS